MTEGVFMAKYLPVKPGNRLAPGALDPPLPVEEEGADDRNEHDEHSRRDEIRRLAGGHAPEVGAEAADDQRRR